jgi:hypothetical protein
MERVTDVGVECYGEVPGYVDLALTFHNTSIFTLMGPAICSMAYNSDNNDNT